MKKQILNTLSFSILLTLLPTIILGQQKNDKQHMDAFVTQLMSKMTLEEKLGQLNLLSSNANTGPFASKKYAE